MSDLSNEERRRQRLAHVQAVIVKAPPPRFAGEKKTISSLLSGPRQQEPPSSHGRGGVVVVVAVSDSDSEDAVPVPELAQAQSSLNITPACPPPPLPLPPLKARQPVQPTTSSGLLPPHPARCPVTDASSWADKHMPQCVGDALLNPAKARKDIMEWWTERLGSSASTPKVLVLVGPSGCGKSTFIKCLANRDGIALHEAEDVDTPDKLEAVLDQKVMAKTVGVDKRPRAWLFTGVDGLCIASSAEGDDDGGDGGDGASSRYFKRRKTSTMATILAVIERASSSMAPVVFTLHDFDTPDLRRLKTSSCVKVVYVNKIEAYQAGKVFSRVWAAERTRDPDGDVDEEAKLSARVLGAVRGAFTGDLRQSLTQMQSRVLNGGRDNDATVSAATERLLNPAKYPLLDVDAVYRLATCHDNTTRFVRQNCYQGVDIHAAADVAAALCDLGTARVWKGGAPPSGLQQQAFVASALLGVREARRRIPACRAISQYALVSLQSAAQRAQREERLQLLKRIRDKNLQLTMLSSRALVEYLGTMKMYCTAAQLLGAPGVAPCKASDVVRDLRSVTCVVPMTLTTPGTRPWA